MPTKHLIVSANVKVKGKALKDFRKQTVGYKLPDGTIIKPVIALEVQKKGRFSYITGCEEMRSYGFDIIDYHTAEFQDLINLSDIID